MRRCKWEEKENKIEKLKLHDVLFEATQLGRKEAIDEVLKLPRYKGGIVRFMVESKDGYFIKIEDVLGLLEVEKLKDEG